MTKAEMNEQLARLQSIWEQSGMNQTQFARSLGLSQPAFSRMFTRDAPVSRVLAQSCELVHGFRADWILTGEGPKRAAARDLSKASHET